MAVEVPRPENQGGLNLFTCELVKASGLTGDGADAPRPLSCPGGFQNVARRGSSPSR